MAPFELSLDLFVHRLPLAPPLDPVDFLRTFGQLAEFTRPRFCAANRTKFSHRFPIIGNDDGVAARRVLDKPRELRLGFVEIDLPTHKPILDCTRYLVNASAIGGVLMQNLAFSAPLIAGGGIKIGYDVLLYRKFQHIKPLEEV